MELESMLMNKSGIATQNVARTLMALSKGDRIPSVSEMCELFQTSRGNIQIALNNLKNAQAVSLRPRGHMGTFVESIDYLRLGAICGNASLVGVMPLPYSKKYEGLATGLYSVCNRKGLDTNIAFMRGSESRYNSLRDGRYNFAVMSQLAFEFYEKLDSTIHQITNLGNHTYVNSHAVITREALPQNWDKKRIGIDPTSVDQHILTEVYFKGKNANYVPMEYNQVIPSLRQGMIDVCVWNSDDLDSADGLHIHPLSDQNGEKKDTQAVLVGRKSDVSTSRLLLEVLSLPEILQIQREVEENRLFPKY